MDNFWYIVIKEYYNLGLYAASDLDIFVQGSVITVDEKASILGISTTTITAS